MIINETSMQLFINSEQTQLFKIPCFPYALSGLRINIAVTKKKDFVEINMVFCDTNSIIILISNKMILTILLCYHQVVPDIEICSEGWSGV